MGIPMQESTGKTMRNPNRKKVSQTQHDPCALLKGENATIS